MSLLREKLMRDYADHYVPLNRRDHNNRLPAYLETHMRLMYSPFVTHLPAGSKVLDLGCGTGLLLQWLSQWPNITPIGVDASPSQVKIAQQLLPQLEIIDGDGLDYLHNHITTLDGIFCTDVLEHIPGDDLCLEWVEGAYAALVPGGFFFAKVPNAANLTACQLRYEDLTHARSFTRTSLLQLVRAAGFEDIRIVPVRAARLSGRIRLMLEYWLHRCVYRICGDASETLFTRTISAVAVKK